MGHLGEFGAALRELDPDERDDFTFFGEEFIVVADVPAIIDMRLAAGLTGDLPEDEAMAAMWQALQIALDEDREAAEGEPEPLRQFDRFQQLALEKRANVPSLMRLTMKICSAASGRPTVRPSAVGGGPPATSPSSSPSSTHPALAHLRPVSDLLDGSIGSQAG